MVAMTPKSLRAKISKLRVTAPITDSYAKSLTALDIWGTEEVWYRSQKEHWMGWLAEYDGPGFYGRKNWANRTAEFVYNHIGCPSMVLWLAEAAGIPKKQLLAAKRSALVGRPNRTSHRAMIRKIIPWSALEEKLAAPRPRSTL